MKKFILLSICILTISANAFADLQPVGPTTFTKLQPVGAEFENESARELNINHNKHEFIKKGRYTYRLDNNGNLVGYYETSLSGKKITAYDAAGNVIKTYRISPSGKMDIQSIMQAK